MSVFRVGQKVVCVDDGNKSYGDCVYPTKGCVYTVRQIHDEGDAIRLCEVRNQERLFRRGLEELWFRNQRFRPVVERKTDISVFRAMLNTTPETVGAA